MAGVRACASNILWCTLHSERWATPSTLERANRCTRLRASQCIPGVAARQAARPRVRPLGDCTEARRGSASASGVVLVLRVEGPGGAQLLHALELVVVCGPPGRELRVLVPGGGALLAAPESLAGERAEVSTLAQRAGARVVLLRVGGPALRVRPGRVLRVVGDGVHVHGAVVGRFGLYDLLAGGGCQVRVVLAEVVLIPGDVRPPRVVRVVRLEDAAHCWRPLGDRRS
eukprot:CAMPEP_0206001034 /NCGR_PEP_ID=MMETSP1464-20131121/1852_1 /ASSEMBLY_ACC=CAM_ASM_001124 /TAXON_ID=119497 /ORGANISM="Exanthemachrysis gayraliae, Strain RCC1523" /LENGTH=228 /DNA_ID=CAMNT_0053374317 /DNA_START=254 /DNA_END=937 /DNA_ORIENTATION=+